MSTGGAAAGMVLLPRLAFAEAGRIDWYTSVGPEHPRLLDQHREAELRGRQSRRHPQPRRRRRRRRQHRHRRARPRRAPAARPTRRPTTSRPTTRACPPAASRPASTSTSRKPASRTIRRSTRSPSTSTTRCPTAAARCCSPTTPPSSTRPTRPRPSPTSIAWIKANPGQFIYNRPDKGGSGGNFVRRAIYEANGKDPAKFTVDNFTAEAAEEALDPGLGDPQGSRALAVRRGRLHLGQHPVDPAPRPVRRHHDPGLVRPGASRRSTPGVLPETTGLVQLTDLGLPGGFSRSVVLANGVNKDAALKLADFILTEEIQSAVLDRARRLPRRLLGLRLGRPAREVQGRHPDHHPVLPGRRLGGRDQRRLVSQRRAERGPQRSDASAGGRHRRQARSGGGRSASCSSPRPCSWSAG